MGKNLEEILESSNAGFEISGRKIKYYSIYEGLKKYLMPKHEETTKGAIITSIENQIEELKKTGDEARIFKLEKILWLNDHGPRHIDTVIKRASQLLNVSKELLSFREIFCLLSAIQLHDLGNFYGRSGHEQKIMDIVAEGKEHIGSDHVEKKYILNIAQVHGGKIPGTDNKDTISQLKNQAPVLDELIRLRLIAAVLRFADEIADDRFRADIGLLRNDKLPKSSEVYHAYSACLNSVIVDHEKETVELHFDIDKKYLEEKFGKDNGEVFLMEEIYIRVLKMHNERIYCSRYWKPYLSIENILVIINFYSDDIHEDVHSEITFTLSEKGYPNNDISIYEMCPELIINGEKLDGNYFQKLTKRSKDEE
jgi:hypothetical protein